MLLNFWASWCAPCEKELPAMVQVQREVAGRVTFVGVDGMDSRRNAAAMLDRLDVPWASAYDPGDDVWRSYRNVGRPVTVLVDERGRIVARHNGELRVGDLRDLLRDAFGERILDAR